MEKDNSAKLLEEHRAAVQRIQSQVKEFHDKRKHFRVYHGSTSSTRPMSFKPDEIIDISDMCRLLPVDLKTNTVQAEPNVPMDMLADHCLEHGLVPKVVMEFKGITVGGGYSGFSGESSMFRYGLFNNTIKDIEIVLGDGELETASRDHNADLLEHAAGSLGTFGIVTLLTVELIPAKSFVRLVVQQADNIEYALELFESTAKDEHIDFIDGIYFGKGNITVMFGQFINAPPSPGQVLKKMQVHWFSDTIEGIVKKRTPTSKNPTILYLNTWDYLFRYDHGAFWGGKLAFSHFHVPQNRLTRRLADPFLDSRTCYRALHESGLASEYLVQDFGLPARNVKPFVDYVNEILPELQIFLAPCQSAAKLGLTSRFNTRMDDVVNERIIAVGVYGRGPRDLQKFYNINRKLEEHNMKLFGAKLLYARTFYTLEEFWLIYNESVYYEKRKKYRADTLPSVYDKLNADMKTGAGKRRPIRGILKTIWGKATDNNEYLIKK